MLFQWLWKMTTKEMTMNRMSMKKMTPNNPRKSKVHLRKVSNATRNGISVISLLTYSSACRRQATFIRCYRHDDWNGRGKYRISKWLVGGSSSLCGIVVAPSTRLGLAGQTQARSHMDRFSNTRKDGPQPYRLRKRTFAKHSLLVYSDDSRDPTIHGATRSRWYVSFVRGWLIWNDSCLLSLIWDIQQLRFELAWLELHFTWYFLVAFVVRWGRICF